MNKKTISYLRLAVCLAFVITLLIGMAAPSLASNQMNSTNALVGTEQNPANAAITKCLAMGQETTTPGVTFTFQIAKVSLNDQTTTEALAAMPVIGNPSGGNNGTLTVNYTSADVYNAGNNMTARANQTDYLYKETQTLFPSTVQWTRTGIYVYRVTELTIPTYYIQDATRETLTYSKAQYDIVVYVAAKANGTGFYVWAIGAYPILNDEGTQTGSTVGNPSGKVNPQPGGPTGGGGGGGVGNGPYSRMIFTNKYLRHGSDNPPVNPNTDHKFRISKAVTSIGADSALYFNFDVTIQKPVISTKTNYRVYVYEGTSTTPLAYNQITANVQNQTLLNYSGYIDMPIGTTVRFMLKHNQYLAFTNIDAGATYIINELGTQYYTPSYTLTKGGVAAGTQTATSEGGSLSTPTTPAVVISISPTNAWIDKADFSNKYRDIIPTGIAVNDLPFITMIAIAAIGLGGYLFFRIRSHKKDEVAVEAN